MAARPSDKWNLYLSPEHSCHYLPNRQARILVLDDQAPLDKNAYSRFSEQGFRRSGGYLYRPACIGCQACQSLRIPVNEFRPDRSQRRTLARNVDLDIRTRTPCFDEEHYELFKRYVTGRHPEGGMEETSPEAYMSFLDGGWTDSVFHEFRDRHRLLAVAVVDRLASGLSAVYTFFEPDEHKRSLGTFAILTEIEQARRYNLPWLYLGYWVCGSEKMDYKSRFRPHEILTPDGWQAIS